MFLLKHDVVGNVGTTNTCPKLCFKDHAGGMVLVLHSIGEKDNHGHGGTNPNSSKGCALLPSNGGIM